jgi:hypothetical protein
VAVEVVFEVAAVVEFVAAGFRPPASVVEFAFEFVAAACFFRRASMFVVEYALPGNANLLIGEPRHGLKIRLTGALNLYLNPNLRQEKEGITPCQSKN